MKHTLDLRAVRSALKGPVLAPGDEGYDEARRVWNAMIDRRPAVILRCTDTADVVAAVRFAREHDLLTSVRGGGHNIAGLAVCDDGAMIDLSLMRGVEVDPAARRAVVQGGATWADFDAASQQHGLATTGGHIGSTGVGGLTLGGGFGWLHGKHGLASDNLLAAEVVTAEGAVLRASADENADLFWGLRGGGGNFGVVTSFTFQLHEVGEIYLVSCMFPIDKGPELVDGYEQFATALPHPATSAFGLGTMPEAEVPMIPAELRGQDAVSVFLVYPGGTPDEAARFIEPIRAMGPTAEMAMAIPYLGMQQMMDTAYPDGMGSYWKSGRLDSLSGAGQAIVGAAAHSDASFVVQLGGQISEIPRDATAFAHRDARFQYIAAAQWEEPDEEEAKVAEARKAWAMVEPHTSGAFVNFVTTDDWTERTDDAYGLDHGPRLAAIKKTYDPDNFFRMNANIVPA